MAIRILKRGIYPATIPMRGSCNICGTEVECDKKDAKREYGGDVRDNWDYCQVECPVCHHAIRVF